MAKKDAFGELLGTALAQDNSLSSMVESVTRPSLGSGQELPAKKATAVSADQRRAVDNARNAARGRGRSKGKRKMIAFQAPEDLVDEIENLVYALGKTKNDLYVEALENLIKKYSKYLSI